MHCREPLTLDTRAEARRVCQEVSYLPRYSALGKLCSNTRQAPTSAFIVVFTLADD